MEELNKTTQIDLTKTKPESAGADPAGITDAGIADADVTDANIADAAVSDGAESAEESAPVEELPVKAAKPKKRKKRRLRKWARVTLGAIGAVALLGAGYRIAISSINADHAVAAGAPAPSVSAESTETPEAAESVIPIASEIDAQAATEDPAITEANTNKLPLGNRGRLYIGDWSVQLNGDDNNDASALQTAADEPDSASYAEYDGKVMISDHANQGFSCIKALKADDKITLKNADGEETALVVVATYPDAYYKDGYAMLPDGTDAWKTQDGEYILQTNGDESGDTLYIVTCKTYTEETAEPEASASASAEPTASASAEAH